MDAQMPGLSGTELIAELRARSQGAHLRGQRQQSAA